ncbi:ABC transporter ATP-binding protein [Clostridiisalibacter paucivorans]|uniref:betaine/proline/choline family ABC transporter ATP-binding protein n=1 Tax=Clostridiisalibacter paucivorans TaxID=408753 RepID=UPI00047EFBD1|nr:ABC transporter ATP-binding protein [Clostridiisalibacter paucivorans]
MIEIKNVVKEYPKMERPAVDNLSLDIEEGKICVFLGPSGCGKTTTLKMINRIIEPTSGAIYVNGINVLEQNPDELRRGIGYVIQKTGLFPHLTVYDNIATVPRLLKWDEEKIRERVDNLLTMVELDPEENKNKYPKALSGGQRQRVGVARALAGNPPCMLMDEPFSAVDPVTRTQLQNEFLRIQRKLKKTICFVTHDIDEAIKMGDKIAIIDNGSLVQYDTPENILLNPVNEFVEDFVGSDRSLKVLSLLNIRSVMKKRVNAIKLNWDMGEIKEYFENSKRKWGLVSNDQNMIIGYIARQDLSKGSSSEGWRRIVKPIHSSLSLDSTLRDAMAQMLQHDISSVPVIDEDDKFVGIVDMNDIQKHIGEAYNEYGQEEMSDINVSS